MNSLQKALTLNAIFSGISGLILVVLNSTIAKIFGTENNTVFWIIGLALIFFTATIAYEIIKQRTKAVQWIIIQDFIWVIGSIILLILNPFEVTIIGNIIIAIIAAVVLLMGINQWRALKKEFI